MHFTLPRHVARWRLASTKLSMCTCLKTSHSSLCGSMEVCKKTTYMLCYNNMFTYVNDLLNLLNVRVVCIPVVDVPDRKRPVQESNSSQLHSQRLLVGFCKNRLCLQCWHGPLECCRQCDQLASYPCHMEHQTPCGKHTSTKKGIWACTSSVGNAWLLSVSREVGLITLLIPTSSDGLAPTMFHSNFWPINFRW